MGEVKRGARQNEEGVAVRCAGQQSQCKRWLREAEPKYVGCVTLVRVLVKLVVAGRGWHGKDDFTEIVSWRGSVSTRDDPVVEALAWSGDENGWLEGKSQHGQKQ